MKEISVEEFNAIPWHSKAGSHYQDWCRRKSLSTTKALVFAPEEFPLDLNGEKIERGLTERLKHAIEVIYGPQFRLAGRTFPDGSIALLLIDTSKEQLRIGKTLERRSKSAERNRRLAAERTDA